LTNYKFWGNFNFDSIFWTCNPPAISLAFAAVKRSYKSGEWKIILWRIKVAICTSKYLHNLIQKDFDFIYFQRFGAKISIEA